MSFHIFYAGVNTRPGSKDADSAPLESRTRWTKQGPKTKNASDGRVEKHLRHSRRRSWVQR